MSSGAADQSNIWWALLAVFLFAGIAGVGMFALYDLTYPSLDDFQRFVYNNVDSQDTGGAEAGAAGGGSRDRDNALLRSDPRMVFETIQHIVDAQNASWNMYLQFTAAIVIALCIVVLLMTGKIGAEAGLPVIAAIVGAIIGNAIQPTRARDSRQGRPTRSRSRHHPDHRQDPEAEVDVCSAPHAARCNRFRRCHDATPDLCNGKSAVRMPPRP